ncbi:MAG: UpxY family transcription antiterminator [Nitrospira sp.]|nr:UpxY family transcription antiterminator [Nitrospira sp.]MBX3338060.1 UpxY family transcription antiterminator [Nitrospira sp.]MCW5780414.1 UpxY family transcription antiterminator [Nitrospira sp.]
MLSTAENGQSIHIPEHREIAVDMQWYALSTRSRHEKQVRDRLAAVGVEPFLPLTRQLSQWSDRRVWTENPLFLGYCFARFSLRNRLTILQTPGIVRIVGITLPEPISDEEIAALKQLAESERPMESHNYFAEGALVQVVRGPLAGLRGQLLRKAGQDSLVIRVHLIQQAATVHIDMNEVVAVQ